MDIFTLLIILIIFRRFVSIIRRNSGPMSEYDWVNPLWEGGITKARKNGRWFHIRSDGSRLYPESYDWVCPFFDGVALVGRNGKQFCIRSDGSRIR